MEAFRRLILILQWLNLLFAFTLREYVGDTACGTLVTSQLIAAVMNTVALIQSENLTEALDQPELKELPDLKQLQDRKEGHDKTINWGVAALSIILRCCSSNFMGYSKRR